MPNGVQVVLNTLRDCQLAVSIYPTFAYNAEGGGGAGTVTPQPDGTLRVSFDPASLQIPVGVALGVVELRGAECQQGGGLLSMLAEPTRLA